MPSRAAAKLLCQRIEHVCLSYLSSISRSNRPVLYLLPQSFHARVESNNVCDFDDELSFCALPVLSKSCTVRSTARPIALTRLTHYHHVRVLRMLLFFLRHFQSIQQQEEAAVSHGSNLMNIQNSCQDDISSHNSQVKPQLNQVETKQRENGNIDGDGDDDDDILEATVVSHRQITIRKICPHPLFSNLPSQQQHAPLNYIPCPPPSTSTPAHLPLSCNPTSTQSVSNSSLAPPNPTLSSLTPEKSMLCDDMIDFTSAIMHMLPHHLSLREIYYRQLHFYPNQNLVNAAVTDVCAVLGCSREMLGVLAGGRGLLFGPIECIIRYGSNTHRVNCSQQSQVISELLSNNDNALHFLEAAASDGEAFKTSPSPMSESHTTAGGENQPLIGAASDTIPPNSITIDDRDVTYAPTSQYAIKVIIVLEKEGVFDALRHDVHFLEQYNPILITSCGYPTLGARRLLCALHHAFPKIPIVGFFDCNPHGVAIMLQYAFGSQTALQIVSQQHKNHWNLSKTKTSSKSTKRQRVDNIAPNPPTTVVQRAALSPRTSTTNLPHLQQSCQELTADHQNIPFCGRYAVPSMLWGGLHIEDIFNPALMRDVFPSCNPQRLHSSAQRYSTKDISIGNNLLHHPGMQLTDNPQAKQWRLLLTNMNRHGKKFELQSFHALCLTALTQYICYKLSLILSPCI